MWKLLLALILFAGISSCSQNPAPVAGCNPNLEYFADHPSASQNQAVFIKAVDEVSVPLPEKPVNWIDENFWSLISTVSLAVYEFLALKIPTSKTMSIIGNLYKLITWFLPEF